MAGSFANAVCSSMSHRADFEIRRFANTGADLPAHLLRRARQPMSMSALAVARPIVVVNVMNVVIEPTRLAWVASDADDPHDLCAHGGVRFVLGGEVVLDGTEDYTLSAAGLYLLRTLQRSHTRANPVGLNLFPCCGNTLIVGEGEDVIIQGCPFGADFEIRHDDAGLTTIQGTDRDSRRWSVSTNAWRVAVLSFADAVMSFIHAASPKQLDPLDEAAYQRFLLEWKRRRQAAES